MEGQQKTREARRADRALRRCRRGATLTETTIVLMVFLVLVFGMIDLGIMVSRSQSLSEAARSGAREAIVRGEFAISPLGPSAFTGVASDSNAICDKIRPQLLLMDPAQARVNVTWPDGGNEINQRVHVRVEADFTPIMTFIFGAPTWTLHGDSEMYIAH
jgi:Flp pilus assembly protein TadG